MSQETVFVELGERRYPVVFADDALPDLVSRVIAEVPGGAQGGAAVVLVSDRTVSRLHGRALCQALREAGQRVVRVVLPEGEAHKRLVTLEHVYTRALGAGIDRRALVLAHGGGMVSDLAGFAAATMLRGLPWAVAPTTVLAQVDASIGGKTGVNLGGGKNQIGVIHQPRWVFADRIWLRTLPPRQVRSGLAEVIKHGAIGGPSLLAAVRALAERGDSEAELDPVALGPVLRDAAAIKAEVVALDERERGLRRVLNFGHTLGHALEADADGGLLHGEAVALGMAFAAEVSMRRTGLPSRDADALLTTLQSIGLRTDWWRWIRSSALERLALDKKVRGRCVNLVLLKALGVPTIEEVSLRTLRGWIGRLTGLHRAEDEEATK